LFWLDLGGDGVFGDGWVMIGIVGLLEGGTMAWRLQI